MATNLVIKSVANAASNTQITVVTSGAANGSISFKISRTPYVADAVVAAHTGTNPYTVTIPHEGLWYVWATDTGGTTVEPGAVWAGLTGDMALKELSTKLRDILWDNRKGIEAILRTHYPSTTLKQVLDGFAGNVIEYPSICVHDMEMRWWWAFVSMGKEITADCVITCIILHQDPVTDAAVLRNFAEAVTRILQQPAYETLTLPSGWTFNFANCSKQTTRTINLDDSKMVSLGSVLWEGIALFQDTGS